MNSLRPVVGRTIVHDAFQTAGSFSEAFGGSEGGRLLLSGMPARKRARKSAPPSRTAPAARVRRTLRYP